MDDATIDLILHLQFEDVEEELSQAEDYDPDDEVTDRRLAFSLYRDELTRAAMLYADRRLVSSLATAMQQDAALLEATAAMEEAALSDRRLACYLGGVPPPPPPPPPPSMSFSGPAIKAAAPVLTHGRRSRTFSDGDPGPSRSQPKAGLGSAPTSDAATVSFRTDKEDRSEKHVSKDTSSSNGAGAESENAEDGVSPYLGTALAGGEQNKGKGRARPECVACGEEASEMLAAPCSHEYCARCTIELFQAAVTDEALFPVRCCRQPIPVVSAMPFLPDKLLKRFEAKQVEYQTSNRTYCCNPSCSTFIPPWSVEGGTATCVECGQLSCTICKQPAHAGDCPQDAEIHRVLELARETGWQRCYSCRSMVELNLGCNHIV
ncbi:MAG: hypothetical protein M1826_001332 [Phylliscum demangeonii]|nr:MAG: hypothetical protein M1826_001332 [Phylliscum demangeonii]